MNMDGALPLLKITPPFSFLDEAVLASLAAETTLALHPKGSTIQNQSGPAAEHLSIVESGAVKVFVRTDQGEEVLVDYRSRGDFFGLLSFACGDISRDTIVAVEDTACRRLRRETVIGLLKTNAVFAEYCFRTRLKRLVDMTYRELRDRTLMYGGGDKLLFTNVLGDLAARDVATAPEDATIREAAALMAERKISSLVLLDADGYPSGMLTDRDLRARVVAKGRDPGGRVGDIMSVTLIKAEARDYCFEALLKMIRYNIHHLLVVEKGELKGIITNHDLMMLQGTSPLAVAREIESRDTADGLAEASRKTNTVIALLVREGSKASHITRIMTEINDRLLKKVLELTEARMGPPPVSYCWIVFGSEGRKEQTFRTDQDNAIIHEEAEGRERELEDYFSRFAGVMQDSLAKCGFPPCRAGYMASNPKWRRPLSAWKKYFSAWIQSPTPEAILQSLIFFDFRPVHGNELLAEQLRAWLGRELRDGRLFLAHMAAAVVQNRPPLGFFGGFRRTKTGPGPGTINLKINGLSPVIDAARLSALESGVYQTSTLARLRELSDRQSTVSPHAAELEQAFEFLMSLRLRHQQRRMETGAEADNLIDPDELGFLERQQLKTTFRFLHTVQEEIRMKYRSFQTM